MDTIGLDLHKRESQLSILADGVCHDKDRYMSESPIPRRLLCTTLQGSEPRALPCEIADLVVISGRVGAAAASPIENTGAPNRTRVTRKNGVIAVPGSGREQVISTTM